MLSIKQTHEEPLARPVPTDLFKQLVDIEILYLLTLSPKSGYELRKQLANGFKINVSYGTLYPHLHALENSGFVVGNWERKFEAAPLKKRIYSLTAAGREVLRSNVESLAKITLTMQFMMTRVNSKLEPQQSNEEHERALTVVENFLASKELSVKRNGVIAGFSGVEYPVELYAHAQGSKGSKIIVRIAGEGGVTTDDIFKTHVMSFDLETSKSIILTNCPVPEEIQRVADFYHIRIYGGTDLESAAQSLCGTYDFDQS